MLVTAPDEAVAERLSRALLERRLVACCNLVGGVRSLYRWEGRVEDAREVLIVAKTTRRRIAELEQAVAELHPYDVPEFVVLDPAHVAGPYLDWLRGETGPDPARA